MTQKSDDNQALKPVDLVFILAIAGRIDAQSRILAQKLDKDRHVYYAYSVLDSLSSSYSMFKYFFDVFATDNSSDAMHDMMMTPGGIIAISIESLFLVSFSFLACHFDGEKEDNYKKLIASAWPYFRDVMKGLKNAYKGWRSAVVAFGLIGNVDLKYLIAPVGIILGIFAAANRFWLRQMLEDRKRMMSANAELLVEIKKLMSLSHQESLSYLRQIKYQSRDTRDLSFLAVTAGGLLDGLYLYVGVLGLAVLSPHMLTALAIICVIYTIGCMITRIYEEYDFQQKLVITQTKCKLALTTKEMETSYARLLKLIGKNNKNAQDLAELHDLQNEVLSLITRFEQERLLLNQQSTRTYLSAALLGVKNGLYAYGALASILFLVGSILLLTGAAFPPALLIACVTIGLVFIAGFTAHSLIMNYWHLNKKVEPAERPYSKLLEMKDRLKENQSDSLLSLDSFQSSLKDGLFLDSSPQFFFQEWFEVIRSLFSGFGKGQKFVDFAGNPLQDMDDQGHYHDSPVMYVLAVGSAILFGVTLGLRALARGFGRPPLGQVDLAQDNVAPPQIITIEAPADEVKLKTGDDGESIQIAKPRTDSLTRSDSYLSLFGIFETKTKKPTHKMHHSKSEGALTDQFPSQNNTILGLT